MKRCALPSCVLLAVALAACGGKSTGPKIPQVSIPGPTAWDGTPPAPGTVSLISPLPGDDSKFVDYEVDPVKMTVTRTIVDDYEKLGKLLTTPPSDPMDNAGTAVIYRPPPPPPDGQDLLRRAQAVVTALQQPSPGEQRQPQQRTETNGTHLPPTHQ